MGLLSAGLEKRALPLDDPAAWRAIGWGQGTSSGVSVTHESAMTFSAVFQAVRILAETVAMLPLPIYQTTTMGKEKAKSFYLYQIIHDEPNPLMTAFEFREAMQGHLATWGNAYAEIELDSRGRIVALWPLRPDRMEKITRDGANLTYHYRLPNHRIEPLPGWRVFHVRGFGADGLMGYSVITLARQAIGLGLAAEKFGGAFFGNGASVGGVLQHPGVLSDTAYNRLKESWDEEHGGLSKAMRTAILEEGVTYSRVGIPPEDAQFLQTRQFQVTDIARWFNIPPHRLMDLERSTNNNIEQQSLEFVIYSAMPWMARWEQAINTRLMTITERKKYFAQFIVDGLLRGDIQGRYAAYNTAIQAGFMTRNEVREKENMNRAEELDTFLVPLNMAAAGGDGASLDAGVQGNGDTPSPDETVEEPQRAQRSAVVQLRNGVEVRASQHAAAAQRHRLEGVYRPLFADVMGRIVRREANDIGNAAARIFNKRDAEAFREWLQNFYDEHVGFVQRQLSPIEQAYAAQVIELAAAEVASTGSATETPDLKNFVDAYIESASGRMTARNLKRLLTVLDDALASTGSADAVEPLTALESELENWRENRAETLAADESVRGGNAFAMATYGALGVIIKRWITFADNCPYCDSLAGRTVELQAPFISANTPLQPAGAAVPLITSGDIGHAPAHRGCDCMVVAG